MAVTSEPDTSTRLALDRDDAMLLPLAVELDRLVVLVPEAARNVKAPFFLCPSIDCILPVSAVHPSTGSVYLANSR